MGYKKTPEHCRKVWESRRRNGTDKHSEETKRNFSLARLGLKYPYRKHIKFTQERKDKIRAIALAKGYGKWMTGKKHSEETKRKCSQVHKGQKSWNTGLTKETDERLKKGADKRRGKSHNISLEKKKERAKKVIEKRRINGRSWFTDDAKQRIGQSLKKWFSLHPKEKEQLAKRMTKLNKTSPYWLGKKRPESSVMLKKLHQEGKIPVVTKETSIEIKLQKLLKESNIEFQTNYPILGRPDIFIKPNICIFADGCYWHKCKECGFKEGVRKEREKDVRITRELQLQGYVVIRLWEHQINANELDLLKNNLPQI